MSEEKKQETRVTFSGFVVSLAANAAVHFGDVTDPATGANSTPDLEAASQIIDILSLLHEKTRGNLTGDENELLTQILYELRMRFVEAQQGRRRIIVP